MRWESTRFSSLKKGLLSGIIIRLKQKPLQYKIPQDVQIEDKIVGPLTLKQLIILGVGGGISYAIYTILAKQYYWNVWLLPTAIPALLTLAFTFLKIGGIPFGKWLLLSIEYFVKPKKRVFVMGGADMYMYTLFADKTKKVQTVDTSASKAERDHERLSKIGEISKALDTYSKPHPAA